MCCRDGGVGSTKRRQAVLTMSCELALGRPYDLPGCAASANPYMSCKPAGSHHQEGGSMRIVGMGIHRSFAQVAVLEDGRITGDQRIDLVHHRLVAFARTFSLEDE